MLFLISFMLVLHSCRILRRYNIISGSVSAFSSIDFNGHVDSSDDEFDDDGELVFGNSDDDS